MKTFGPTIVCRSLSKPVPTGKARVPWQYHSRSDRHSKIVCWSVVFDLLRFCPTLREHVGKGRVAFGINHEMSDFKAGRKKDLDLVICVPGTNGDSKKPRSLRTWLDRWKIELTEEERAEFDQLPDFREAPVGSVQLALEAKACMTEHSKARPRLYDELNSSHLTIHGSSATAIAAGFVMINASNTFQSPGKSEPTHHRQPGAVETVIEKIRELPRRASTGETGFDALAIMVLDCANDGVSEVRHVSAPPAPRKGEIFSYDATIQRLVQLYESRFPKL